jgi:hypothetical protein
MADTEIHTLACAECGCVSDETAAGWRAYYDTDDELVLFCAECAAQVFGAS